MSYQKCGDNDASVATFVANFFVMLDNADLHKYLDKWGGRRGKQIKRFCDNSLSIEKQAKVAQKNIKRR